MKLRHLIPFEGLVANASVGLHVAVQLVYEKLMKMTSDINFLYSKQNKKKPEIRTSMNWQY
jgi:hypothetical protein